MNNHIRLLIKKDKLLFSQMEGYMLMYSVLSVTLVALMGSFTSYPIVLSVIFLSIGTSSTIVHEEEQSKCNLLVFTLPVSVKDYLKARYLYFIIYPLKMTLACSIIGMIINWLTVPATRNIELVLRHFHGYIIAVSIGIILPVIFLPLYYMLGASKSRIIFAILAGFFTVLANPMMIGVNGIITAKMFILPIIAVVVSIIFCYISYRTSIKNIHTNPSF